MKISKIHQRFSDYLEEPKALTNPEDYLGPNWKDVINFWFYIDTLNGDEKQKMDDRYWSINNVGLHPAMDAAYYAAQEVVGSVVGNMAWRAVYFKTNWGVFVDATRELIASHKLLEQGKTLLSLSTILN